MWKKYGSFAVWVVVLTLMTSACGAGGAGEADGAQTGTYDIVIEPIGHWHVNNEKELMFTVTDTETSEGVAGLALWVNISRAGSDRVTVRSVDEGDVVDVGDGTYSLAYNASSIGAYGLNVEFEQDGTVYSSPPVAFEVARDGEEGISIEADGTEYVYQIRYNWDPGHIHANDEEAVALIFELKRAQQTGSDINHDMPWTNTFDHISDAQDIVIEIYDVDGNLVDEITDVSYEGEGEYQASRIFGTDEVGDGMDYEVRFIFTDPFNGAEVTHVEAYPLHAVPGH